MMSYLVVLVRLFLLLIMKLYIYHNKNIGTMMVHFIHVHRFFIKFIQFMHITKEYQHHVFVSVFKKIIEKVTKKSTDITN